MDQIRIVKEMRRRDRDSGRSGQFIRPRYMVWENVPGAFSSGKPKGADFAAVIEEIIKVCEPDASLSVCVPDGGWTKSGCYYAEDGSWSIAWRVHDAQFWGVPQRRKRIALVADFGGLTAPEILFERKGLHWDPEPSGEAGKGTASGVKGGVEGASVGIDTYNHTITDDVAATLNASSCDSPTHSGPSVLCLNDQGDSVMGTSIGLTNRGYASGNVAETLRSDPHGAYPMVAEPTPINTMIATRDKALGRGTGFGVGEPGDAAYTISTAHEHAVFSAAFMGGQGSKAESIAYSEKLSPSIKSVPSGSNTVPDVMVRNNSGGHTPLTAGTEPKTRT
jgi:DNA (cytosine-5)-methyltransferase 1